MVGIRIIGKRQTFNAKICLLSEKPDVVRPESSTNLIGRLSQPLNQSNSLNIVNQIEKGIEKMGKRKVK